MVKMHFYKILVIIISQFFLIDLSNQSLTTVYDIFTKYGLQASDTTLNGKQNAQLNKRPQALSILMNFNLDGTSSFNLLDSNGIYWSDMSNCAHGQMFDPVNGMCRDIFCMDDFYLSANGCSTNTTKLQSYIPDEMKIEFILNNRLCELYPEINEAEDCDTNSVDLDDELKEQLRENLANELKISIERIADLSIYKNKSVIYETHEKKGDNNEINIIKIKVEKFGIGFRILDKKNFNQEEDESIMVYFKLIAFSLIDRFFKVDDEQFTISDVMEITENKYLSWCSDPDQRGYYLDGFRILTLPERADYNHNYFIYVEEDDRIYETGEYYLTVFYDPILDEDSNVNFDDQFNFITSYNKSIDSKRWDRNSSYLDITDYILNTNSTKVKTDTNLAVCARTPKIRNECSTHKLLRAHKCEFEYYELMRKYCSLKMGTCFTVNDYEIDPILPDKYIRICLDKVGKNVTNYFDDDTAIDEITSWLSFLSIVISIIFLLATLITYVLFKSLRKIPAWNVINLTLALFIAQLSFALGSFMTEDPLACFLVSIFTHYGFLAAFFWMNVSAFDLYRNFCVKSKHVILNMVTPRERLPKYLVYGWLGPLIIVFICLIIDLADVSSIHHSLRPCYASYLKGCLDIDKNISNSEPLISNITRNQTTKGECFNYEENIQIQRYIFIKSCYIQNGRANLLFFGLPIGLIIVINAIFYTITIYNIRRMKTKQYSLRRFSRGKVASDNDVKFYIQMAVTMGFTWIFGFLSSTYTTDRTLVLYEILVFCFIISNGLIGILIFFAFIFKKEVFFLYRQLICEKILRIEQNQKVQYVFNIKISDNSEY